MSCFLECLQNRIASHAGGRILVGFSGGPDSLALLAGLQELGTVTPFAAHLNHMLRGSESDADEVFARQFCAERQIPFFSARQSVAETGGNLEQEARNIRYDWLTGTAQREQIPFVATGHTANDQAETVLFHMLRGTSLRGLRGIAARRPLTDSVTLIRPMLDVTRGDVEEYLTERKLVACLDRSNADSNRSRNRIRHELLPMLQTEFHSEVVHHLARIAEHSQESYAIVEKHVLSLRQRVELPRAGGMLVLSVSELLLLSPFEMREVFHGLWEREGWPLSSMGYKEWSHLTAVVTGEQNGVDLPGRVHARRRGKVLQLERNLSPLS